MSSEDAARRDLAAPKLESGVSNGKGAVGRIELERSDIDDLERNLVLRAKSRARRDTISRIVLPLLVVVGLLVGWEIAVRELETPTYLVPAPTLVAETLVDERQVLVSNSATTLVAIFFGFVMAVVGGIVTAILTYSWKPFERGIYPLLVATQAVPKVAIAPLFAIWFGFSVTTRSLMAFLLAFFPVLIGTLVGLRSIAPEKILLARSVGLSRTQTFVKIRMPQALPSTFGGLKVALALAAVGAVVGEFIGGSGGLGYLIQRSNHDLNTPLLFAALTVLAAYAIVLFIVVEALERWLLPWHSRRDQGLIGI